MTLVAVWRTPNHLMAIADTRIVRGPGNVLTEHGPKILPITVICRQPDSSGSFGRESLRTNIGFAYSGSTLSALSSHALANTLLSNLVGNSGVAPPSLLDLAFLVRNVSDEYMREVAQLSGINGLFGAIIFGFCPQTRMLRGFEIRPELENSTFLCQLVEHDLQTENSIVIIGSSPDLLRQRIEEDRSTAFARGDVHPVLNIDRPTRALQAIINEELDDRVGGAIQQGWATERGFEIASRVMPITPRPVSPRNAGLFVLGFDVMDIQQVGSYMVAIGGR